jgi:alkylhydroperoxidase/carboxymuconolactone decarboxylase family protein YurZ
MNSYKSRVQLGVSIINIAIQTCNKNPTGVKMHAIMAKKSGAKREEVLGAVTMNLHLSGLSTVLECLPSAIDGYDTE